MMLDRIVEVFCEVDDFCQAFLPQWEASLLGTGGPAPRGPQPGLSTSEIITLLLVLHSSGFKHLKSFYHGFAEPLLRGYFPGMPCYEHFVALQKSVFVPLVFFLLSHLGNKTGVYYIDSTRVSRRNDGFYISAQQVGQLGESEWKSVLFARAAAACGW
jgi:hypothetical protein